MADRLAHSPNLALATLVDCQLDVAGRDLPDLRRSGLAILQHNSIAQSLERPFAEGAAGDARDVALGHLEAGVRQLVGEVAVIGQQNQPGRIYVEPPNWVEPPRASSAASNQLDDSWPAVRVGGGRYDPGRLIQCVDDPHLRPAANALAIEEDLIARINVQCWVENDLAVNADSPGSDQRFAAAARGDSCVG